jgi:hypothetical protein
MTVIGLLVIVVPPSMRWRNGSPVQVGWHSRLFWNRRGSRHGDYGRGMPPSRRRMSSRPEVTPGAPESSGDRNAGIAMCRTPIKRQRRLWLHANVMGRIKPYWRCASRPEIGIRIDAGVGANRWPNRRCGIWMPTFPLWARRRCFRAASCRPDEGYLTRRRAREVGMAGVSEACCFRGRRPSMAQVHRLKLWGPKAVQVVQSRHDIASRSRR